MQNFVTLALAALLAAVVLSQQDDQPLPDVAPKGKNLAILPEPQFRDLFNGKD